MQLLLRSILQEGMGPPVFGVCVVGDYKIHAQGGQGYRLALLLEMRLEPPLLGSNAAEPLANVVCYEATLGGGSSRKGYVVLRPGYVAFLPKDMRATVLRAITGRSSHLGSSTIEIPLIIEQLRYLPSEAELVHASPGRPPMRCVAGALGLLAALSFNTTQP